jgi:hypothetical protein
MMVALLAVGVTVPLAAQLRVDPDEKPLPPDTPASLDGGATINPALLESVRDNTLGLEPQDRHAYFYMLWLCRTVGTPAIAQFAHEFREQRRLANPRYAKLPAHEFPTFVDVFQHPQVYRGRPVTLRGYFRRLVKYEPGENDLGIRHVYEGWLYTLDSQSNPAVVIFTKKPEGLPIGGDLTEEVQFSGYFLKMYGYAAQDTTRKAPLFIAGEVQWFPHPPPAQPIAVPLWLYAAAPLVAAALAWGLWQWNRKRILARRLPTVLNPSGRDFDAYPPAEFLESNGDNHQPPIEHHH